MTRSKSNSSQNNNNDDNKNRNFNGKHWKIEPARKALSVAWRHIIACDSGPAGRHIDPFMMKHMCRPAKPYGRCGANSGAFDPGNVRGDHRWQRSSPCESPKAACCAGRSRHELSGQRMKMKQAPESGRASALRVNIAATLTPIFKTRITPCRIAVRAEIKKSINGNKNRRRIALRWASRGVYQRRNMPFSRPILQFTDD